MEWAFSVVAEAELVWVWPQDELAARGSLLRRMLSAAPPN